MLVILSVALSLLGIILFLLVEARNANIEAFYNVKKVKGCVVFKPEGGLVEFKVGDIIQCKHDKRPYIIEEIDFYAYNNTGYVKTKTRYLALSAIRHLDSTWKMKLKELL